MKIPLLNRESNTITVATFHENYLLKKYNMDPAYQRKSVWTVEKQSFFIDSILKNFPMPPIFLKQNIDDKTGKTFYDVIDGKQRLTSLIRFINNEIPVATELENNEFDDPNIAGMYFDDLDKPELSEYKRRFWRYVMPIEYIDTTSELIIENIFDRLNRNGEPLEGQELRHAKYHDSPLYKAVQECVDQPFWKERLKYVDLNRMEDDELISEFIFMLLKSQVLGSGQKVLDDLYAEYAKHEFDQAFMERFIEITHFMESLELDFEGLQISGVSHLYGLWTFSWFCLNSQKSVEEVKDPITDLFVELRSNVIKNEYATTYKRTMVSNTKSKSQRQRRLDALIGATVIEGNAG